MKYDGVWLSRIHQTRALISDVDAVIEKIPFITDRGLVKEQFALVKAAFRSELASGCDTSSVEANIYQLGALAEQLVEDGAVAENTHYGAT